LTRRDSPGIDVNFLDSIHYADVYSILYKEGYRHFDLIAEGIFAGLIPDYTAEKPQHDTARFYEINCEYALHFLDGYLKGDAKGIQFLANKPDANGIPQGLMTVEFKKALKAPPREWEIANMIRRAQNVEKAKAIIAEAREQNKDATVIREGMLNQLGYEFLFQGNHQLAIEIFQLNVDTFPGSANTYDSLSNAYQVAGKTEIAVRLAEKALEVLPNDQGIDAARRELIRQSAEDRLKKLTTKTSSN
jgi:tetratricopeptide (TPR) repeat protein